MLVLSHFKGHPMGGYGGAIKNISIGLASSNGKANIFSVAENSQSWTNFNKSKTMASVLSTYKFDIVCMQEYFKLEKEDFITDWNDCYDYIKSNYRRWKNKRS